jgi:hypothetical protein
VALVLEIAEGEERGREVALDHEVEVGRGEVELAILDDHVSRHHARISPWEDGAVIEDLGSTNGTYVNDQPVQGRKALRQGDRIRFGLTVIVLRPAGQPLGAAAQPQVTEVGQDVLQPASERELSPPRPRDASLPSFMVEESEPAFVPRQLVGDPNAASDYGALARLVDSRVKHQTSVAAFAVLALSGLAVLIFFGVG